MDQEYMTKVAVSFLDELSEIEKKAFVGKALRFLGSGAKKLVGGAKQMATGTAGTTAAVGGKGATRAGGVMEHMKQIYKGGATPRGAGTIAGKAVKERAGGTLGGLGALARSRYGQMGAVGALGAGGLVAGKRMMEGRQRQPGY
jgi:hypothetical protein